MSIFRRFWGPAPEVKFLAPKEFGRRLRAQQVSLVEFYIDRIMAEVAGAKGLSRTEIRDHLPDVIDELIQFLNSNGSSKDYRDSTLLAKKHGRQRAYGPGYSVSDLRHEYGILREVLLGQVQKNEGLAAHTAALFSQVLEMSLSHATEVYVRNSAMELIQHQEAQRESAKRLNEVSSEKVSAENQRKWFEVALDRLPKPVFILDQKEKIVTFSNEAARQMLGITYAGTRPKDTYGKILKMTSSAGVPLAAHEIPSSRVFEGEVLKGVEVILDGPGGVFHLKAFSEQLPEAYGYNPSAILILQDITALKKSEAEVLKVQADLNEAVEIAQVGFWHLDVKTQKITVTPLLMKQFGLDPQSFKSTLAEAVAAIHREDRDRVSKAINDAIENRTPYSIEYRVVHRNGEVHWIEANGASIYDAYGNPVRFTGTTIEVTERVHARLKLQQSTAELRMLADSMPQIVWAAQPDGQLDYFNQVWFDYSGSSFEENRGAGWTKFVHPDDLALTADRWAVSLETGRDYENEFRLKAKNGEYRWHVARAKPIKEDGKIRKWYGTNTDIHDQKILSQNLLQAQDRAERANSAKSQFLANMSHEIRTPLGAIMGFASLLKDSSVAKQEREGYLSVIERNSGQLLRIIDDILDLSKVEAGMMIIEHVDFSLPEMLADFASLMGFKAREKGILFLSRAVTPIPKIINADPTRLRQILMNVVGNAIKFTDKGHVEMRICYKDGLLDFEIEDTGRGISPEEEINLFQPFTQADPSITRKYGGTGLGLVLTRSLSEALGGRFELKHSKINEGSTFSVKVKVEVPPGTEFVKSLGYEPEPVRSVAIVGKLAGLRVLLVEDSPDNQALISIFLGRAGARIDIASDGQQGHRMAVGGDYDVILMDVQMPIMDGITAVKLMRADAHAGPVIALTAHAMKEERVRCLQAGFTDFLSKPVNKEELIEMLAKYDPRK